MIKPLGETALVEQIKREQKVGSLYVTGSVAGSNLLFSVLAVGEDLDVVKVGNTVLLREYTGRAVDMDGKQCKMVERGDILAVVE